MSEAWSQWEGQIIDGRFELKRCLGTSGQSAVFLTEIRPRHPLPGQAQEVPAPEAIQLAIKLIAADPAQAARQLSRWRLAQILYHPNLLRVFDTGRCRLEDEELIFGVMEYADENLAQIIPERALTVDETRQMLEPTLDALAYLHGQGLVHGCLTPAHVLAMGDQIKLSSDWISPAKEAVADAAAAGVYDAPEAASGVKSAASDVWSLGMVLSEALTQHLPVHNGSKDSAGDPRLPEDFPAPFLEIVRGCLRRDPELRWTVAGVTAWLHPETSSEQATVAVEQKANVVAEKLARPSDAAAVNRTSLALKPELAPEKPPAQKPKTVSAQAAVSRPASSSAEKRNLPAQSWPQPSPRNATKPPAAFAPLDFLSWTMPLIRRFGVPAMVAIAALGALYAAVGLLHRESRTTSPADAPAMQIAHQNTPATTPRQKPRPGSPRSSAHSAASQPTAADSASSIGSNRDRSVPNVLPISANAGVGSSRDLGVAQQVMPAASRSALATIQGTVRVTVKVKIDSAGNTAGVEMATPGPSAYFARLSQEAAQQWKFDPAQAGRSFLLHFEFRNNGISAYAARAGG